MASLGGNAALHVDIMFAKARANGGGLITGPSSDSSSGRQDGLHPDYDSARKAAKVNAEGNAPDLGPDTFKMYDPETGTLIGEMSRDSKRGWRLDEGHFNWWNWTEGKKWSGGKYGHEFFGGDTGPHSRYIGYANWYDPLNPWE